MRSDNEIRPQNAALRGSAAEADRAGLVLEIGGLFGEAVYFIVSLLGLRILLIVKYFIHTFQASITHLIRSEPIPHAGMVIVDLRIGGYAHVIAYGAAREEIHDVKAYRI